MAELFDVLIRHQVYVEGLKRGQRNKFSPVLAKLNNELRKQLSVLDYENLGDITKTALNKLLVELRRAIKLIFDPWLMEFARWLEAYMNVEVDNFSLYYDEAQTQPKPDEKQRGLLFGRFKKEPMANGVLVLPFAAGVSLLAMQRIERAVMNAYVQRLTKDELLQQFFGSKARKYSNGIAAGLDRAASAATNTGIQHISVQVSAELARKFFKEYEWVSVLDDKTTDICESRDGKIYTYGKGPLPPAHPNCRSSTVPIVSGVTVPQIRFDMWAARQPDEFIEDAFDGRRAQRYEGTAAISLDEFKAKQRVITL